MKEYNAKEIEKNKKYVLVAFPYPSGSGLHIGHAYSYGVMDSYCRYLKYIGNDVFQPFGFDAHGLPTELYAKKIGRDPHEVAIENIENFKSQMSKMNTNYDIKFSTADESYVKWTQWIFTKLNDHGLAYKKFSMVNWCNSCETAISDEQVKDKKCERCNTIIEEREMNQWYFKITDYKDRLIKNLDWLDYPEATKKMQRNWLENLKDWSVGRQRKFGTKIPIEGEIDTLDTFVDSSFYFIRYCDPDNSDEICSEDRYKQVDLYCMGSELSTNHLIYSRFINMFLYDIGIIANEDPFKRVIHNGMIIGSDGQKMSKSKGNVVNPDDYDSDELRFYLFFIAHFFDGGKWSDQNISGIRRFISKFKKWMTQLDGVDEIDINSFQDKIFKFTESFKFNKVVSEFMIFTNNNMDKNISKSDKDRIISIIKIYMPGFNI